MRDRKVVFLLILIMSMVSLAVAGIAIAALYRTALAEQRARLVETAQSQARLIEAVARFDAAYSVRGHPAGWQGATLSQIVDAHQRYEGFGETGEFTLARREGPNMVFLLSHRHGDRESPAPVPFDSTLAEPMRRSLSGLSGTVVGLDYRGVKVLAAYEPVAELGWGIVAKIDLAEIRAPFGRAGIITGCAGLVVVLVGAVLFIRVSYPLLRRLEESEARTRAIVETAADGIITINDRGVVESFNRAAEQIFSYAADEAIGQNISVLVPPSDEKELEEFLTGYLKNGDQQLPGPIREAVGRRKDGAQFPVDLAINEVRSADPRVFTVIVRDITERKRAEEQLQKAHDELERRVAERTEELTEANQRLRNEIAERQRTEEELREAEHRYRMLFEQLPDAVVIIDPLTTLPIEFNDLAPRLLGYSRDEFARLRISDYEAVEKSEETRSRIEGVLREGRLDFETGMRTRQGEIRDVHVSMRAVEISGRTVLHNILSDITERKRAEEAVREHARLLEAFFQYSLTAIVFLDRDFNFIRVNEAYARACQRDVSEFPGHNHFEFYPSDAQKIFEEVRETKIPFQTIARPFVFPDHPEWGVTYWDWTLVPILDDGGEVELLVFSLNDVTERKEAEEAHRLDEACLEALVKLNEMAEAPFQQLADFALEEAVKVTTSKMGFLGFMSEDESVMTVHAWSKGAMDDCRIADKAVVFRIVEAGLWGEAVRQRQPIVVNDYQGLTAWKKGYPEGHVQMSRFLGVPVFDGERIVAVAAVANKEDEYEDGDARQLTLLMSGLWRQLQRRQAQDALRESEERLQAILDNTTAVIYLKDATGRYILVNRRFEELFHLTCAEIVGKIDDDLWSEEQANAFRANDQAVLRARAPVEFEEEVIQDDGLHTYISIKFPLYDAAGELYGVCGISTDITERKRVEERLRRSERLASLGTFAAGIAHEVNNPLTSILMTARHALNSGHDRGLIDALLQEITGDTERCARIVKSILQFAKQEPSQKRALNLNGVARRARDLSEEYARRRGVRLELRLSQRLPAVFGNWTELEQVFVNVINNAIEASRKGQNVFLRTEQTSDGVRVCVEDRGRGMTLEEKERVFDPFFTTRAKAGGTGLGLSMAHGIVTEHGGAISIEAQPGMGTTVAIELPLCPPVLGARTR